MQTDILITVPNPGVSPNLKTEKDPHVSWFLEGTFPNFTAQKANEYKLQ